MWRQKLNYGKSKLGEIVNKKQDPKLRFSINLQKLPNNLT